MPANIDPRPAHTLVAPATPTSYTFRSTHAGLDVEVEFRSQRDHHRYTVPRAEAVALWRRLVTKGFERF